MMFTIKEYLILLKLKIDSNSYKRKKFMILDTNKE